MALRILISIFLMTFLSACSMYMGRVKIDDLQTHHKKERPWTSLSVLDRPEKFQFLVVTDRTGGAREGVFEDAAQKIDLLQPAFVMSVGDMIQGYTEDESVLNAEWDEFDAIVDGIDAPFFYTPGNHDWQNKPMAKVWTERLGRSYYHFIYKDTLFLIINSELFDRTDAPWWRKPWKQLFAKEQTEQLAYIRRTLAKHKTVRWTFVFLHKPYWRKRWVRPAEGEESPKEGPWPRHDYVPPEWTTVETMLEDRDYTIFAGHLHTYEYGGEESGPHTHDKIALATTGGVSTLRGVEYGEFDHMVWVTMTKDGPVIANLLQKGILGKKFPMPKQRPYWVE